MRLCINPNCQQPENKDNDLFCLSCGSELLLQGLYRVCRELGGGGFGKTYEVAEGDTFKVLKVLILNNPIALRLFQQEAEVLKKLNHPGIPKVDVDGYFEFLPRGSQNPLHCLVMEKIEGEDLQTWLEKRGQPINQKLALKWLIEIAEILHQVHGQGFLHRDLKPPNIMLRSTGQLALIDFGTVKEITATVMSSQAKKQGTGVYTPGYAPPEQEKGYTVHKSDFFALGRTFVHLLTNKYPLDLYNPDTDELNWRGAVPNLAPLLGDFLDELMQRLAKDRPKDTEVILQRVREIEDKLYSPVPSKAPQPFQPTEVVKPAPVPSVPTEVVKPAPVPSPPPQPVKKVRLKLNYKRIGLVAGIIVLGLGVTQFYWYIRYGSFPVNPIHVIRSLPSSRFLQKTITSGYIDSFTISPDGKTIVSASGRIIEIWDLATGKLLRTLTDDSSSIDSVTISPDGQRIISDNYKGIKIWDLATGKLLDTLIGDSDWTGGRTISPDSKTVVGWNYGAEYIRIWDVATGKLRHTITDKDSDSVNNVTSLVISPDSQTIVIGSSSGIIQIRDLATGQLRHILTGHSDSVEVVISPDGRSIVSGSYDNTIKIWDLATGQLLRTLTSHSDSGVDYIVSPDSKKIVSGSSRTIKIWDLATGKLLHSLDGDFYHVSSIAISSDNQTIVAGVAGSKGYGIKIWDLATGKLPRTFVGHSGIVTSVAISPDGQTLVSGSYDDTIKIWRLER